MARRWIALLRAVNLGPRNKVPMAELRRLFEEAGAEDVRTWIQSGNVVFSHEKPEPAKLEAAIADGLGVKTVIVLRSARQMKKLADSHPFGSDTSKSHVAFFVEKPRAAALRSVSELDIGDNQFEPIGSDIALYYPRGFQGATLTTAQLEKLLGIPATARNWRTVEKLAELAG
ncbi:MAG TPA: DUF1697 domain-containing protein [Gaiellaceae bacterium]|nr:DUF1697 domain-containing protein [Gaiellaceae bacterium]